uniref:Uncharacterized protein n=1 Tax=Glossina brevipalpis TaxID=37001 RepID=A0A1A9W3P1_9MUSC
MRYGCGCDCDCGCGGGGVSLLFFFFFFFSFTLPFFLAAFGLVLWDNIEQNHVRTFSREFAAYRFEGDDGDEADADTTEVIDDRVALRKFFSLVLPLPVCAANNKVGLSALVTTVNADVVPAVDVTADDVMVRRRKIRLKFRNG